MLKLYSQLIGCPVFDDDVSRTPVTLVQDLIIDPETGKVLAFLVKNRQIIVPADVERLGSSSLTIADSDRIIPMEDVLRVHEVFKKQISLIGSKVVGQPSKMQLGRVFDYEIDTVTMALTTIHCSKIFFFFHIQDKIFSYRRILRISKDEITVKDSQEILAKEKVISPSEAFAA
ncbi:MAG: PRC-barrel domain-containing protein [Patescibacteria group bacterium]